MNDASSDPATAAPETLSGRQKAAIIVRLLLDEGVDVPLSALPEHLQAALTEQFGNMRLVDRATLTAVIKEFAERIEAVGLAFPGGIDGALSMLNGRISTTAAMRLRRLATAGSKTDPWERIATLETERLVPLLEDESPEVGAVVLSKLSVATAADLLERLPGDKARRVAYAIARTNDVDPETVRRIGVAIAARIDAQPPRAFDPPAAERIGAILNVSPAQTREHILDDLTQTDADLGDAVRRAIFTFADIPRRIRARDIPRVLRLVEQPQLVAALSLAQARGGADAEAAEAILSNMSQRMADALRDEIAERGTIRTKDGEAAMNAIVGEIRTLVENGDVELITEDDTEEA